MPPAEIYAAEMPDAIALVKAHQPQVQPLVARFEQAATNQRRYPQVQKACHLAPGSPLQHDATGGIGICPRRQGDNRSF